MVKRRLEGGNLGSPLCGRQVRDLLGRGVQISNQIESRVGCSLQGSSMIQNIYGKEVRVNVRTRARASRRS
jgi:hypothetical protein